MHAKISARLMTLPDELDAWYFISGPLVQNATNVQNLEESVAKLIRTLERVVFGIQTK